jgi:hypothetical protein
MTISYTDLSDSRRPDDAFKRDFALSPQQTRNALRFPNHHIRRGTLIAIPEVEAGDEKIFAGFMTIAILAAVAAPASVFAASDTRNSEQA